MKKQLQKVRLSKETLRNLSDTQMERAAGGQTTLCGGTSSGDPCTGTLPSDCYCATDRCTTAYSACSACC